MSIYVVGNCFKQNILYHYNYDHAEAAEADKS